MKPVVTVRPEPGTSATKAAGEALGLTMVSAPLWAVRPRKWDAPDPATIDGLLIGSANALRHGGASLGDFVGKPVHAVGQTTADLAEEMGHKVVSVGDGGLQKLVVELPPTPVHLLRLAGEQHQPLYLPHHITLAIRIAYETVPIPIGDELAQTLQEGALVLLHSALGAVHFVTEVDRLALPRERIAVAALAPRIAAAAGEDWADCRAASTPRDAALLALAAEMCQ